MTQLAIHEQVKKPRGQQHMWDIMLELNVHGGFTLQLVHEFTNASQATVADYIKRLRRGGFLSVIQEEPTGVGNSKRNYYHITKMRREAPRLRKDGTECPPTKRESMWRTMRMIGKFSCNDLVVTASPETPIKLQDAKDYCKRLHKAGYLRCIELAKRGKTAVYILIKNTGPKPPMVQRTKTIFDPNLNKVVLSKENRND